jgi:hypothetical protein
MFLIRPRDAKEIKLTLLERFQETVLYVAFIQQTIDVASATVFKNTMGTISGPNVNDASQLSRRGVHACHQTA